MGITVDGLISGLDTAGIFSKLVELEARPINLIEAKQVKVNDKLTAWQELNTKLLAFETTAKTINTTSEFQAVKGTFTNSDASLSNGIVTLSVNSNVKPSSYNFTVNSMAQQQKVALNQGYSSTTADMDIASISINTASSGTFTFQESTLSGIQNAINNAGIGKTATIINTSSDSNNPNYILSIASDKAGATNAFTVSFDIGPFSSSTIAANVTQTGQDLSVTIDGVTATRDSNIISDLIDGVTINVFGTGNGTIDLAGDATAVVSNIESFVSSYNDLMADIADKTVYNNTTKESGVLLGSGALRNIELRLRSIVTGSVAGLSGSTGNLYSSLSQIGIKSNSSNQLEIDTTVLTQAITADIESVTKLFVPSASGTYTFTSARGTTTPGSYETQVIDNSGTLAMQMRLVGTTNWVTLNQAGNFWEGPTGTILEGFAMRAPIATLSAGETGNMNVTVGIAEQIAYQTGFMTEYSNQGTVFNQQTSLEQENDDYDAEILDLTERLAIKEKALRLRFSQLEVTLAGLKGQGDYLTSQLANLPKSMA